MSILKKVDGGFSRIGTAVGLYQAVPAATVGAVTAYYSTGVAWLAALGPFGWITSGVAGFFVTSASLLMLSSSKLRRVEATAKEKLSGQSSAFDPMETVYRDKRLYLRDLAPLGRKQVTGKKFINCEIIGPGTIIIGLNRDPNKSVSVLKRCNTYDCDCIEIDGTKQSFLAVSFWDCDFESVDFHHLTLLFLHRENQSLNWITKNTIFPVIARVDKDDDKDSSGSA